MSQKPALDPGNAPPEDWSVDLTEDEANELRQQLDDELTDSPAETGTGSGGR